MPADFVSQEVYPAKIECMPFIQTTTAATSSTEHNTLSSTKRMLKHCRSMFTLPMRPKAKDTMDDLPSEDVKQVTIKGNRGESKPALVLLSRFAFRPITGDTSKIPTVFLLLRHAEATHNAEGSNDIRDPELTEKGKWQCQINSSITMKTADNDRMIRMLAITHIVCSPARRALQTALIYFAPLLAHKPYMKIIVLSDLKERGGTPSSKGTDIDVLKDEFKGKPIDFSRVTKGWEMDNLTSLRLKIDERAKKVREQLAWIGEDGKKGRNGVGKYIVVVAHGGIFQHITKTTNGHTHWQNCGFQEWCFQGEDPTRPDKEFTMTRIPEVVDQAVKTAKRALERLGDPENQAGRKFLYELVG